jgi:hypothetical protein
MRAKGQVGEAIFRSNPASFAAEESVSGFAQESVVLIFGKPAHNRTFGFGAD